MFLILLSAAYKGSLSRQLPYDRSHSADYIHTMASKQRNAPPSGDSDSATKGGAQSSLVEGASSIPLSQHAPSLAGSVIEASDGLGGEKLLIRIQNMSSTANLGVKVDLKKIALKCRNTEFNPRRFGAVIMRLREPRATALIFASGKMVVTGVKSTHNAHLSTRKFAYIVERVGFQPAGKFRSRAVVFVIFFSCKRKKIV